jgi:malate synthase
MPIDRSKRPTLCFGLGSWVAVPALAQREDDVFTGLTGSRVRFAGER